MISTELFFAPDTPENVQKAAQQIPPYDLLKAYRDACVAFSSNDIVLLLSSAAPEGFTAMARSTYIDQAFRRWTEKQRKIHPLASTSAHKKLKVPRDTPAFWLVIESPDHGAIVCCAIGAYRHALSPEAN